VRRSLTVTRQPSRAKSPNDARNPAPSADGLLKAPPRVPASPGTGHDVTVFVGWEQSTTNCHSAPPRQPKIDDRSVNVDENKGPIISAAGPQWRRGRACPTRLPYPGDGKPSPYIAGSLSNRGIESVVYCPLRVPTRGDMIFVQGIIHKKIGGNYK